MAGLGTARLNEYAPAAGADGAKIDRYAALKAKGGNADKPAKARLRRELLLPTHHRPSLRRDHSSSPGARATHKTNAKPPARKTSSAIAITASSTSTISLAESRRPMATMRAEHPSQY